MARKRIVSDRIGKGVILPFIRHGSGISTGEGADVVVTQIAIVLETLCARSRSAGELPYNQRLGCLIQLLRHKSASDLTTREHAAHYVEAKIRENVKHARITKMKFSRDLSKKEILLDLEFDVLDREGGNPIISGLQERFAL